jgi:UDP-N-acetylglucosamine 2-epimerase (non-hydrolysing)
MPLKVLSIFGTRPEAIKMAPVVHALAKTPGIDARVCVTAQHREMLDQVLTLFGIIPDFDLDLMKPDQSLAGLTADILTSLDPLLAEAQPDWILVQGDTTTVMTAALTAFYRHIKVGHVEAGLRTGDKWQPFPEEINRRVASAVVDLHFAPTEHARQNLLAEGIPDKTIYMTGNPIIDALYHIATLPEPAEVTRWLADWGVRQGGKRLALVTAHRRENWGDPLEDIFTALRHLAEAHADDLHLVYPVHLNPHVQEPAYRMLANIPNLTLLPPLEYLPLVHLLKHATLALTDSGGIQEEATGMGVPTLVMREVTERPEGVEAGVLKLVGTDPQRIFNSAHQLLTDPIIYQHMRQASHPFGDGHASERIVAALLEQA